MRQSIWVFLLLSLAACQHRNIRTPTVIIPQAITENHWLLSGKILITDGRDGGSGALTWSESNGLVHAKFKAPLGQGAWELDEQQGFLKNDKGQSWTGDDMAVLLEQQLGWEIPWLALKQSIKGHHMGKQLVKTSEGSYTFEYEGWLIEWKKIKPVIGAVLPHKIYIKKAPYAIKISVKKWQRQH